ncbi:MAG: 2-haloacid dehalogenase [Saprospiraceae bacterium]|jgi:2-haloacid dehalogenase
MIKTIIFDLGGVLIDWNPQYVYKNYFETQESLDFFFKNVCTFDWNEKQDAGRKIVDANTELIKKFPEYKTEILVFYGRWEEMLGGPIAESVKILQKLKDNNQNRLIALTNWSAETWPVALRNYDFLNHFEGILVSGKEGIKKPNPAIYELILTRYGLIAEECLFIDDNLRNIEAAKKMGISGIRFKNPDQLFSELNELGIL